MTDSEVERSATAYLRLKPDVPFWRFLVLWHSARNPRRTAPTHSGPLSHRERKEVRLPKPGSPSRSA
jgi:hypothetical protein